MNTSYVAQYHLPNTQWIMYNINVFSHLHAIDYSGARRINKRYQKSIVIFAMWNVRNSLHADLQGQLFF